MSRGMKLTKYFLKNSFEEMFGGSKKMKTPVKVILFMLAILALSTPLAALVGFIYSPLKSLQQEGMVLSLLLLISVAITFFFGTYNIMNIFYFSNDIEQVLPLPFKSGEIVFAKFMTVLFNMLIYSTILILPLITYGVISGANIIYYLYMIIVVLIIPIFPMVIASIISIVLMRFVKFSKHKDGFKIICGCLSLILIVGFNFVTQSSNGEESSAIIKMLSEGNNSLVGKISGVFLTNKFSALALSNCGNIKGIINILLALLVSILIFAIFYIFAGKIYLKSVIGISESYNKRENILKEKEASKLLKSSSPLKALVIRDIKIIYRTPQFFINCIAMLLYMPLILGIAVFAQGNNISEISKIIQSGNYSAPILGGVFLAIGLFVSSAGAGTSAISREGKDIIISKYIPISFSEQLNAKIVSSMCINGITTLIILIALIILKVNFFIIILGTIISITTTLTITLFGMFFDYNSPNLEWEDEKSVMKNNFMPVVIMLAMLVIGAILLVMSFLIFTNPIVMFLIIMLVNCLMSFLFYKRLLVYAEKIYNEV